MSQWAWSEARKTMTSATSWGTPHRRSGVPVPPSLTAEVALDTLGHHAGVGARVDGEVAIDADARNQADAIAFDRGRGRIDVVVDRVSVVIDENAAGVLAFSAWAAVD